ncbi:transposase [Geobacillus stearothermophilus]|nr:transposase [Geobacillus stearothermophilus]
MSTKRRTYKSYSPELKLEAVKRALSGESVKVIAHHFDITDPDYIYKLDGSI